MKNCGLYIVIVAIVCGMGGYFLDTALRKWAGTPADIEASEERALQAIDSVALLLQVVDSMESELQRSDSLYLTELLLIDSIRSKYAQLYPRISSADAGALHRLADSLLAGYAERRARHRMLLDSASARAR